MLFSLFPSHAPADVSSTQESTLTTQNVPNESRDIGSCSASYGKISNAYMIILAMFSPYSNGHDIVLIGVTPK